MKSHPIFRYNTTVFAFGQTGSGKTFTITGPEDTGFSAEESQFWGIVPRYVPLIHQYIFSYAPVILTYK